MVVYRTPHYFLWALGQIHFNLGTWPEAGVALALLIAWRRRDLRRTAPIFLAALAGFLVTASQVRFNAYSFETFFPFLGMLWAYSAVMLFEVFSTLSRRSSERGWKAASIGISRGDAHPTAQGVLDGLYSLHNETLGGLAPPLTFVKGKANPVNCTFLYGVKKGKYFASHGSRVFCQPNATS